MAGIRSTQQVTRRLFFALSLLTVSHLKPLGPDCFKTAGIELSLLSVIENRSHE